MKRLKSLNRVQKASCIVSVAMIVLFAVLYAVTISRTGFLYQDQIFVPEQADGSTVYSATLNSGPASFTVTQDRTVTFRYGEKVCGPYTYREDPDAIPESMDASSSFLTGVEIRKGEEIYFRGAVERTRNMRILYDQDGNPYPMSGNWQSNGALYDADGNEVDPMEPSAATLIDLMYGPELTHKGNWIWWLVGAVLNVISILYTLFTDEVYHFYMSFRMANPQDAEPSGLELVMRYVGWVACPIIILVFYVMGLR